jgi:hypothetical protein
LARSRVDATAAVTGAAAALMGTSPIAPVIVLNKDVATTAAARL